MKIKVWGCRGSIPTPSTADFVTSRYGGNTTCISVRIPGHTLILDGGSGLRTLGLELVREKPLKASFLFSHVHWDHIQGFPFFVPCFIPGNEFDLYGPKYSKKSETHTGSVLENALRWQQRSLNFPVQLKSMPAKLNFHEISAGESIEQSGTSSKLRITAEQLQHPGGCFGYRIEEHSARGVKIVAFCTDTEHLEQPNPSIQKLALNADLLLHDAQYTQETYDGKKDGMSRKGWGHSTWNFALREAVQAKVKRLLLVHHDPLDDDWNIARIENDARHDGEKVGVKVDSAHEGLEIEL